LKSNKIPKGLVPLEQLFDRSNTFQGTNKSSLDDQVQEVNIGSGVTPRIIKISKACTPEEKRKIVTLVREYRDVFAWYYDELKAYDPKIINHAIPLLEVIKPFRQRLRYMNPKVALTIQKELQKLYEACIIEPIRYSHSVANYVPVRKKSGEIHICIDLINLNRACLKDNCPLPSMKHILQAVTGSGMMSMLDGFSSYNQVLVDKQDRYKTAFITPWGTYSYIRMPFGLMNAGATFQCAMDYAFSDYLFKFILVYQDDLTIYSKTRDDHVSHLRKVFDRCRSLGISLNPKKSILGVFEGKLLGHIVSKKGVRIDPERIKRIMEIPLPSSRKGIQSFFDRINVLRCFVPNFAEIAKPIYDILKKDDNLKWSDEAKKDFNDIKQVLCHSPILISLDYAKDF
jgi:hypothetical protein